MIGTRLKLLRERAGLSQPELGHKIGLPGTTAGLQVSMYERNARTPSVARLYRLAQALDCEPGDLLDPEAA